MPLEAIVAMANREKVDKSNRRLQRERVSSMARFEMQTPPKRAVPPLPSMEPHCRASLRAT